jgi:hypothetical protein
MAASEKENIPEPFVESPVFFTTRALVVSWYRATKVKPLLATIAPVLSFRTSLVKVPRPEAGCADPEKVAAAVVAEMVAPAAAALIV